MKYCEIGGMCDMEYVCDICSVSEYTYDTRSIRDHEAVGMVEMFRDENKIDVCSYCLQMRRKNGEQQEFFEGLMPKPPAIM